VAHKEDLGERVARVEVDVRDAEAGDAAAVLRVPGGRVGLLEQRHAVVAVGRGWATTRQGEELVEHQVQPAVAVDEARALALGHPRLGELDWRPRSVDRRLNKLHCAQQVYTAPGRAYWRCHFGVLCNQLAFRDDVRTPTVLAHVFHFIVVNVSRGHECWREKLKCALNGNGSRTLVLTRASACRGRWDRIGFGQRERRWHWRSGTTQRLAGRRDGRVASGKQRCLSRQTKRVYWQRSHAGKNGQPSMVALFVGDTDLVEYLLRHNQTPNHMYGN